MIEIAKALFAYRGEEIEITNSKIGEAGLSGQKMSAIATIFDRLFKYPGSVAVYESTVEEAIYCEIKGMSAVATADAIHKVAGEHWELKHLLLPNLLFELSRYGTNNELKEVFEALCESFNTIGMLNKLEVIRFCDIYYRNTISKAIERDNLLTNSSIEASFRSEMFEESEYFKKNCGKYLATIPIVAEAAKKSKKVMKKKAAFLDECKDGKYRIPTTWTDEQKAYIQDVSFLDKFESIPAFESLVKLVHYCGMQCLERMDYGLDGIQAIAGDAVNAMLLGKPGTGKSTVVYALSAATGIPVYTIAFSKNTDEDTFEGKTKIIDGHPQFVETDIPKFWNKGGIFLFEEPNLADAGVTMGAGGQALEFPYIIFKNGYERTERHPLSFVVACENTGIAGTRLNSPAFSNRFEQKYVVDDPTRETFINILQKSTKATRECCEWVYGVYEKVVNYLKSPAVNEEDIVNVLSIRTCKGAIKNMRIGDSPIQAVSNSIVGAVAECSLEVARNMQGEILEHLPTPTFSVD